jgi:hypothetical protein
VSAEYPAPAVFRNTIRPDGWSHTVKLYAGATRAGVDVHAPDGRHFAFELAVFRPDAPRLDSRLVAAVNAWVEGAKAESGS